MTQVFTSQFSIQNQSNNNFVPSRWEHNNQYKNTVVSTRQIQNKKETTTKEINYFQDLMNQEFEFQEEKGCPTHKKWKEIIFAKWVLNTVSGANIEFEDISQIRLFKECEIDSCIFRLEIEKLFKKG